jgi:hypothetical protein
MHIPDADEQMHADILGNEQVHSYLMEAAFVGNLIFWKTWISFSKKDGWISSFIIGISFAPVVAGG